MSRASRRSLTTLIAGASAMVALCLGGPLPAVATGLSSYTFEGDAIGAVPAGCSTPAGRTAATVSDEQHYEGSHALRVYDNSTSSLTLVNCADSPRQGAYLSFEIYPAALANGVTFNVNGEAQGTGEEIFHFLITSAGKVEWYNGGSWQTLSAAGVVPVEQWSDITLTVSPDDSSALLRVNGAYLGTAGTETSAGTIISSITGFGFGSYGTAYTGDDAYVDDVDFGTPDNVPPEGVTTRGFESDAIGAVPAGCTTPSGRGAGTVSSTRAYSGSHSVRIDDNSASSLYVVNCAADPQEGAYLSFEAYPNALAHGFLFDLQGSVLLSTSVSPTVFHFYLTSDGSLQWYDGANWRALAPAGTARVGQWSKIEVAVPADNSTAHLTVNGTYVGSGGPAIGNNASSHNAVTAISGYEFASSGTAYTGDDVFIDDVSFGAAADTPSSSVGTPGVEIGLASTIDDVGQVQLPSADVVVPNATGHRVLASYPAHSDSSTTTGNRMAYSDDDGVTWTSWQTHNPMPDAPSLSLTLLDNGDLLAVSFHTYMVSGSSNLKADVDTAISHDDGATWTMRTGLMATAQQMMSLGSSERSGVALGGFVLIHSVLEDSNGTLYQSAYGKLSGDTKYRQLLLVSTNGGIDWTIQGTVATADPSELDTSGYEGPCEGAIERLADGSLLAVMRTGSYLPAIYSRSTDDGATWSTPARLRVGPSGQPLYSVVPTMEFLQNGRLLLMTGRPGIVMTVSTDGLGDDWSTPVGIDYTNSENFAFTPLDSNQIVLIGDRGRVAPWQVWARTITINAA